MGKKFVALALTALLSVGAVVTLEPSQVALAAEATPAAATAASARAAILADTNAARRTGGHASLRETSAMDAVAQAWAKKLVKSGELAHNPNYSSAIPSGWTRAGENVAGGYSYSRVTDAWLDSPGHRANIMGDFTDIGIGYAVDSSGTAWAVQNFAKYAKAPGVVPAKVLRPSVAAAKGGKLVVSWKAPKSALAITSYKVVIYHGGKKVQTLMRTGSARSATSRVLRVGASYRARVLAHNSDGWSVPSAASSPTRAKR